MRLSTLTDTGPLVALVNRNDPNHGLCLQTSRRLPYAPLLSTWPCFTEAMHLGFRAGGYPAQVALWDLRRSGRLVLHNLTLAEIHRMEVLMEKYRDLPMDLADASLIVVAESFGFRRIFTLDGDFYTYRLAGGSALELLP